MVRYERGILERLSLKKGWGEVQHLVRHMIEWRIWLHGFKNWLHLHFTQHPTFVGLWIVRLATFCINSVTLSVPCTSVPACLARLIDQKLPQCTWTCRPLSEVRGALLSAIFLRGGHRGFVCRRLLPGFSPAQFVLNPFQWQKTPPLITDCCTPLIGRWKRGFGFQGWWPPIHVEPGLLAPMEMHYKHPDIEQRFSLCLRFEDSLSVIMSVDAYVYMRVCGGRRTLSGCGLSSAQQISCCAIIEFLLW